MSTPTLAMRAVTVIAVAARMAVGALWIAEGVLKFRAGFGSADILLVADSAAQNSRVPFWFAPVDAVMHAVPSVMGVAIPILETLLGVALVVGFLTPWVAFASIGTLMLYWGSDQLITQYPVMVVLSAVVLALPQSRRLSLDAWWRGRRRRERASADEAQPVR